MLQHFFLSWGIEVLNKQILKVESIKDNTDRCNYLKGKLLNVKKSINKIKNKWKFYAYIQKKQ